MILDGFKSKNIIKKISKLLLEVDSIERMNSNTIENVLLFVENDLDQKVIASVCKHLNIEKSKIQGLVFKQKIDKNEVVENCISKKDFGLFGKLKNESIQKLLSSKVDVIINYSTENEFINSMIANANSSFKVGLLDNYAEVYDMIIDVDKNDFEAFNKELRKYLLILNKL